MKIESTGEVLPGHQGTLVVGHGIYEIAIEPTKDGLVRCVYPGGYVRHHQAESITELLNKVISQIRGRYAVTDVVITAKPRNLLEPTMIQVKV